ncbi:MAG: OmpA family protein [Desulfobacteraceae bacterium]|nr:OmpA family protein [Desulfobacteraceae bacterium]
MRLLTKSLLSVFAFLFLFGCASKEVTKLPSFEAKQFNTSMYSAKADSFLFLFDASSSMYHKYNGTPKFDIAKAIVLRMNDTVPEMGQTAGLRSFGHSDKVSKNPTEIFYGMEEYSTPNLADGLKKVTEPGGFSPLYKALDAAGDDLYLYGQSGMKAVIIVSDGLDLPGDVLASAQDLKNRYGSTICFYPILVGDNPKGKILLQEIAKIGECGFYSTADQLLTSAGMAAFVEKVFLEREDGVFDTENVFFDFDKDVIKTTEYPKLDNVTEILEKKTGVSVELQGHCDNVGSHAYNMDLSMRRSNAVKNYLIEKGISKNRIATQGFGFTKPAAKNASNAGRSMNRRVEIYLK